MDFFNFDYVSWSISDRKFPIHADEETWSTLGSQQLIWNYGHNSQKVTHFMAKTYDI